MAAGDRFVTGTPCGTIVRVIKQFADDDKGYIGWLKAHPSGYVVNCEQDPMPAYLVLHRATCPTINGTPSHGVHGTRDFRKVCAGSVAELGGWAWATVGTLPDLCMRCKPPDQGRDSGASPTSDPREAAPRLTWSS